ncbi:MAG TPA: NHLP bacteriocin system secretion protein [Vicinamibacterales bacterium]
MSVIFRKVTLDRLASPEQLDQLGQITDRRGWIALLALGVVLGTAVVWGAAGTVPQNVSGTGILVKSGGVFEIIPASSGRISDVAITVGDLVMEGQVVARLAQPHLLEQLREAKAVLGELQEQHRATLAHGSDDVRAQMALLARQGATVEQANTSAQASLAWYQEKIAAQEKLVQEGLLTNQTLLTTRQQADAARERISEGQSQLAQIAVRELELRNRRSEEARQSAIRIQQQERAIAELERTVKAGTEVVAPQTGRILEIMTEPGAIVAAGQPIIRLDLTGRTVKDLEAVIYIPSLHGKRIRVGMPALIAPTVVKPEEYGYMLGTVTFVSEFPATPQGMQRVLKNDKLVASLAGGDAPYEVHADLVLDAATPSGYKWSSSGGPALTIQSGTLIGAQVTVDARRPAEMVMPWLRRQVGL